MIPIQRPTNLFVTSLAAVSSAQVSRERSSSLQLTQTVGDGGVCDYQCLLTEVNAFLSNSTRALGFSLQPCCCNTLV